MTGIYYANALDVLAAAGCTVRENDTTNGWQQRARSSGGFPSAPLCVFWHHTASSTSPQNDLAYMIDGSDDAPIGNLLIDRDGACWPIAAGASNCAGKGGPVSMSRGTVPLDSGNTRGWQIEVANSGVGEPWPTAQVDAVFRASNALNHALFGNVPSDVVTHALGAGDGYTDRKIDPATADAVQGSWRPSSVNSSGTWSLADIRAECERRARNVDPTPPPTPTDPDQEDDMKAYVVLDPRDGETQWLSDLATFKTRISSPSVANDGRALFGWVAGFQDGYFPLGADWGPFLAQLPETTA